MKNLKFNLVIQAACVLGIFTVSFLFTYLNRQSPSDSPQTVSPSDEPNASSHSLLVSPFLGELLESTSYEKRFLLNQSPPSNPASMKHYLETLRDQDYGLFEQAFQSFAEAHPRRAYSLAKEYVGDDALMAFSKTLMSASGSDTDFALEMLSEISHLGFPFPTHYTEIEKAPQDYVDRVSELPASVYRNSLMGFLAKSWHESDPTAALEWASNLPADRQDEAFRGLFESWTEDGFDDESMAFFNDEIHGQLRIDIANDIALDMVRSDPDEAFAWVEQHLSGRGKAKVTALITQSLAWNSPTKAASLVANLEHGTVREHAGTRLVNEWKRKDVSAAADWILNLPHEDYPDKDVWLSELSQSWYNQEPEVVMEYIRSDANVPLGVIENVAEIRWREDQTATKAWINSLEEPYSSAAANSIEGFEATHSAR